MFSQWPVDRNRGFLAAATLAHLCISALGGATLIRQAGLEGGPGAAQVALFLVTGGVTAWLLLHMSKAAAASEDVGAGNAGRLARQGVPEHGAHRAPMTAFKVSDICLQAQSASRLEGERHPQHAFSGLMSHVSHELRTPLNAIIGFADMMQRELLGPLGSPRYHEYVRHIRESGLAVLKAAEDTMAFTTLLADRERARTQPLDIEALLDEACEQVAGTAEAHGVDIIRGAPCAALVYAEPRALAQALRHLIMAGVQRTPAGRPLFVDARIVGRNVRLSIGSGVPAGHGSPGAPTGDGAAQLSLAIARALLEMQGIPLAERGSSNGPRRLTVALPLALPGTHQGSLRMGKGARAPSVGAC
ncbi:MAG: sensor histidine kinase [Bacteroidota bacterium]